MEQDHTVQVTFEQAQSVLQAQPFSRLLGVELTLFQVDRVELKIPIRPEHLQQNGLVHGGVLAYAADNAITFAAGRLLGAAVLTKGLVIDYVRPASGEFLRAEAHVVTHTRTQAICRAEVYAVTGSDETLCAVAQGTVNAVRANG